MRRDEKPIVLEELTPRHPLPAGEFLDWLARTRRTQIENSGAEVPCGTCNACCKASYFIRIAPEETETLKRIPRALLFAAPGLPKGNQVMGYNERGHCPMLVGDACSIYAHRPQTCRNYDCRVLTGAGIEGDKKTQASVNERVRRWKFSYRTDDDLKVHTALRDAATFLEQHADRFPAGFVPSNAAQLAVLAVKVYDVFLESGDVNTPGTIQAVVERKRQFESQRPHGDST